VNVYNEIEPYAVEWLRNLSEAGHVSRGVVDERSIVDLRPDDLRGYRQSLLCRHRGLVLCPPSRWGCLTTPYLDR
jgi:hypothetical protein